MGEDSENRATSLRRRRLVIATSAAGGVCAVAATIPFVASMSPSERTRAAAVPVEADLAGLPPGALMTAEWRGKPVWILHRTPEMLAGLPRHDDLLADRDSRNSRQPDYCQNATRSIRPEFFVALALCTHLGCIPTFRPELATDDLGPRWPGGFYCPCHGSKFDLAGRVFKNVPAPLNLEIPWHRYVSESRLLIGDDQTA
jgi:ubiquinol-cytochrome c reductase iron-sulfur subunit